MGAVWVVLLDECDLGEAVARRVEAAGQNVVRVKQGARFERLNEDVYAVNPSAPEDYQTLLRDIHQQGKKIGKIMHLWSVTGATQKVDPAQAQESGFYSLLLLAQALGEQRFAAAALTSDTADALDIAVVSDHMQEVTGEDLLYPDKATLLGACGAIPKEYPNINCRSIDVTLPQTEAATDHLAGQLVAEIVTKTLEEAVAYRGDIRWVQGFERVRLEAGPEPPARLRENGLYLITGGTGGIGLTLAHYLAQTVHARLVLIGRTPFPVREEWVEWLETHQADDPLSVKIRKLQAIEETGAEVLVLSADVSQESAMRAALEEARQRFGQFDGVIHAAGVPPRTLIQRTTPEMAAQVLAPKVEGTRILSQLLRDDRLDFMVLCSSHRSFLPDAGTADYSGANAFLDAFARRHNRVGGSLCISINWDGWLEVGMSGLSQPAGDASSPTNDESLRPGILPHEGVVAFSRILGSTLSQVAVAALDLPAVINYNRTFTAATYWKNLNEANQSKTTYARPETADPYVAPQTDVEQALVEIWQDLLGIAPIGIHDNFFELGGDSVIGLQIIAKANQAGLGLTPGQVFEYQTVAELGAVSGIAPVLRAEQGAVTGPAPLTPIQHWFFEQDEPDPHHWNQSFLMELTENLEPALLERAVRHLLEHHDAVRARFTPGESGWQQTFAAPEESVPFTFFDLSTTPAAEQAHSIEREASASQASLNLSDGPVIRVALFRLGTDRPGRLLIIAHHLVVDNLSWRFLLEDLFTAYRQLKRAQSVELPLKTTSFQYWSQRLADYSQSEQLKRETAYWLSDAQADISPLPVDHPGGVNTVASAQRVLVELSLEETQQLLRDVPKVYNTQINDVLLAALVQAFAGWTGEHALLVGMEGHGREPIFQEVDFTRTVGWFTNLFPAHLRHEAAASPGEALKSVKEQLRRIPNRGIGYGLLRYLSDDAEIVEALKLMPQAEIVFLYQGQQDQKSTEPVAFRPAPENNGLNQSPRGLRSHLFEIGGHVVGSQLRISRAYSENLHERSTVERLAESYIEALRSIITHAVSVEAGAYAAADFPEAGLSQQDLDDIIAELSEFED
jgi:non-ribosomal peptide synthase protein (TIGR01720 family)